MASLPPFAAARVPSLAPAPASRRTYASGEYVMVNHARPAVPDATVRSVFDTEQPAPSFELERTGPISAVKDAPPPSSRELDCGDFGFSNAPPAILELLEVDRLTEERSTIRAVVPPPPSLSSEASKTALQATRTHAVIEAFADFGAPPETIFQTPSYALNVLRRRRELGKELAYARRGRSPDVALYEAAMNAYDASAAQAGFAIIGALTFAFVVLSIAALVWI